MARRRSRGRGARGFGHEAAGPQGCPEVSETHDETLWPALVDRHRWSPLVQRGDEVDRHFRTPRMGQWLNNRAENSHQPFRRREAAMAGFRDFKTLQKFASVHASIHNLFNLERHLNRRPIFKQNRSAALAEWYQLAA
ncbi:hypothetical protein DF3PB_140023 [uncultured Defluviicoccus sp.]|uniref:DDE domain-containing protein n=1 Tax=metagenome TaxID=256318 RepID=A0A380T954_9ZZZZ|nr:hypothetical protein DF3PB_140023 [uncultured Defluviicoccus sp.]